MYASITVKKKSLNTKRGRGKKVHKGYDCDFIAKENLSTSYQKTLNIEGLGKKVVETFWI